MFLPLKTSDSFRHLFYAAVCPSIDDENVRALKPRLRAFPIGLGRISEHGLGLYAHACTLAFAPACKRTCGKAEVYRRLVSQVFFCVCVLLAFVLASLLPRPNASAQAWPQALFRAESSFLLQKSREPIGSLLFVYGAGDGNRTHATSLEGWSSTIELHPHLTYMVPRTGLEPVREKLPTDFKSVASAHSATPAISLRIFGQIMVGKTGFEPATPWSQAKYSTKLSYFPTVKSVP